MRKTILISIIILATAATVSAGSRTLTQAVDAAPFNRLELESGIGDVKITASDGADDVVVEVTLTPRRGGIFSSMRKAERDVETASLKIKTEGTSLIVGIDPPAEDEQRFEERWTIQIPSRLAVNLNHGVGDVQISGVASGVELDSGVGDVVIEIPSGDVAVDLGVGTAVVRVPVAIVKSVECASGVGEARISIGDGKIEGGGFISHAASWEGTGDFRIEVSVGVGDAVIELE